MKKRFLLFLLLLILPSMYAQTIEQYNLDIEIDSNKIIYKADIDIIPSKFEIYSLDIPLNTHNLILLIDNQKVDPFVSSNILEVPITPETKNVKLSYEVPFQLELTNKFYSTVTYPEQTDNSLISLTLPVDALILRNEGSVLPQPTSQDVISNRIILYWKDSGLKKSQRFFVYTEFKARRAIIASLPLLGVYFFLLITFLFSIFYVYARIKKRKAKVLTLGELFKRQFTMQKLRIFLGLVILLFLWLLDINAVQMMDTGWQTKVYLIPEMPISAFTLYHISLFTSIILIIIIMFVGDKVEVKNIRSKSVREAKRGSKG